MKDAICHQCKQPIDSRLAVRVAHPDIPGARWVVCTELCGKNWLLDLEREIPDAKYKVQPEPDTEGRCGCGCGKTPKKGRYMPGHDRRLHVRRKKQEEQ